MLLYRRTRWIACLSDVSGEHDSELLVNADLPRVLVKILTIAAQSGERREELGRYVKLADEAIAVDVSVNLDD